MSKRGKAFTLSEMMIVLLVITVIIAAALPIITKRKTEASDGIPVARGKDICTTSGCTGSVAVTGSGTAADPYLLKVPSGVKTVWVSATGGGGGGGFNNATRCFAGGGGAESAMDQMVQITNDTVSIEVGKGGFSGVSPTDGSPSKFGSLVVNGGLKADPATCIAGGVNTFGGGTSGTSVVANALITVQGGNTLFGKGAVSVASPSSEVSHMFPVGYGGGGCGDGTVSNMKGADGFVSIEW